MALVIGTFGRDFIHRSGDGQVAPVGWIDVTGVTTQDDIISGLAEDDILFGDSGADILDGGDDDDTLEGGADGDILNGGNGFDTASYSTAAAGFTDLAGVTADLANQANNRGDA